MEQEITTQHLISFIRYHKDIYQDFLNDRDYDKLEEFCNILFIFDDFRKLLKGDISALILIEGYIAEIKSNALQLWDLADTYFDDYEYDKINDYCDIVLNKE